MADYLQFRQALLDRLAELDGRLHEIEAELEVPHSKDWEEAAVEREGEEVLEHLGQTGQAEVMRIRAALKRFRDGSYGSCVQCGSLIERVRLSVVPETPFCKTCAATT